MARGLHKKYNVRRQDGNTEPEAEYLVLRLDTDKHARAAAFEYAKACEGDNPELAQDIRDKVWDIVRDSSPVQPPPPPNWPPKKPVVVINMWNRLESDYEAEVAKHVSNGYVLVSANMVSHVNGSFVDVIFQAVLALPSVCCVP